MLLPHHLLPTKENARAVTVYCIALTLFFLLMNIVLKKDPSTSFSTLQDSIQFKEVLVPALIFTWGFFTGCALIIGYSIVGSRVHHLVKPTLPFLNYYFTIVLWYAIFITEGISIVMISPLFSDALSPTIKLIASITAIVLSNLYGIYLMYHYLGKGEGSLTSHFLGWIKTMLVMESTNFSRTSRGLLMWGFGGYLAAIPLVGITALINSIVLRLTNEDLPVQDIIPLAQNSESAFSTLLLFVLVAFIAPFFEELLMRGLIFRGLLIRYSFLTASIASSLLFALFHFNVFAFAPIVVLGLWLSWLYHKTGSLLPSMVVHGLFNSVNFLFLRYLAI